MGDERAQVWALLRGEAGDRAGHSACWEGGVFAAKSGVFRRGANIGEFGGLNVPMQKRFVLQHAEAGGIDLSGVNYSINRQTDLIGRNLFGEALTKNRITLFPDAFRDSETLIRTLGHERTHLMQYDVYGFDTVKWGPDHGFFEKAAYNIESSFVDYWKVHGR